MKIDFSRLTASVNPTTLSSLNKFKQSHFEGVKKLNDLKAQRVEIDWTKYSMLQNQEILEKCKSSYSSFKPVKLNTASTLDKITSIQKEAVLEAKTTLDHINKQLVELNELVTLIDATPSVDDLRVDDVCKALPTIEENVAKMAYRGQWVVPGYYEKFGEWKIGF